MALAGVLVRAPHKNAIFPLAFSLSPRTLFGMLNFSGKAKSKTVLKNLNLTPSLEDYLEAVYEITRDEPVARSKEIASRLSVSKSSVTGALRQLSSEGLIDYSPYKFITLTEQGMTAAREVARRHEVLKLFLTKVLCLPTAVAEESACRMEHAVDAQVIERFVQLLGFLDKCPKAGGAWLKGLGEFCQQGKMQDGCRECLEICLTGLPSDTITAEDAGPPHERQTKDKQVREQFLAILEESGHELEPEELAVVDAFLAVEEHQTIEELCDTARKTEKKVTKGVVKETVDLLCEYSIATELKFRGQTVYEHYHPESHHDHIVCVKCGASVEFFDPRIEALQRENAKSSDFRLLSHKLYLHGVCHNCIELEGQTVGLNECPAGDLGRVSRILGCAELRTHLANMGIQRGSLVRVLGREAFKGGVSILVSQTRLVLDADTASRIKIMPEEVDWQMRRRHHHSLEKPHIRKLDNENQGKK